MKGSTLKNFTMFTKLCGTEQLSNVLFVTTKWDQEYFKMREQYETRQEEMRTKFLQNELAMGAKLLSHNNTIQSATEIVRTLLNNPPVVLKIQTQLVDNKKKLRDTDVGEELNTELTKERERMAKKYAESLADAQATAHNEQLKRLLEKENIALKAELDRIDRQ
jgi:leucyl aminopeptidase